jgi:ketosteroid isomerase-like protein
VPTLTEGVPEGRPSFKLRFILKCRRKPVSIDDNKAAAREFIARLSANNLPGALDMLTEDATWLIPGKPDSFASAGLYHKDRIARLLRFMLSQLKDGLKMTVTGAIAEGDKVALEAESYGELSNGRVYRQSYHFLLEFRDGKISAVREYLDTQHAYAVWLQPEVDVGQA